MAKESSSTVNILRGAIGQLSEYKIGTDWQIYQERLEQYFLANYVEESRKVAVLLTVIGDQPYETLKGLCDPELPKQKTYEQLCQILTNQFSKKVSVFKERIEFYSLRQTEGETIKDFFVKLKNKAIQCKFGSSLNEVLKDRLISGLRKGPILDKICEEDHTVELNQLVEVALKKEAALSQVIISPMMQLNRTSGPKKKY